MNGQMSVSEIIKNVTNLGIQDFENLYEKLSALRLQKRGTTVLNKTEAKLLSQINKEFPTEKWERLKYLDWKLEFSALSETEETESLHLAEAYEGYCVERLQSMTQLATLRQVTIEELSSKLGLNPQLHG
jgi:ABC-type phosphate transport system auxiliary subunit